jgi:2-phospho-L-lactate/phosphoenolpyruvate guanylyltransferase
MSMSPTTSSSASRLDPGTRTFGVVVPVKQAAVAKSRLQPLGDGARRELVTSFAVDTVTAALDCLVVGRVLVVTDDVLLARGLRELGVAAVPDGGSGSLNASLRQGAAELLRREPALAPVALCADLPSLTPDHLAQALAATARSAPSFVADAAGVGTTLYAAPSLDTFDPRFGAGSCAAHLAYGAQLIDLQGIASLRRDVDTPEDLRAAAELGLGRRTSWVVTSMRLLDD